MDEVITKQLIWYKHAQKLSKYEMPNKDYFGIQKAGENKLNLGKVEYSIRKRQLSENLWIGIEVWKL